MKREQEGRRRNIRYAVGIAVGIAAVLWFLLSVHKLLYSEAQDRLIEITKTVQKQASGGEIAGIKSYFKDPVYCFTINNRGYVVNSFGDEAQSFARKNESYFGQPLENEDTDEFWIRVKSKGGIVGKYKLISGDEVYAAIYPSSTIKNGYVIGLVSTAGIDSEIISIFRMAVCIILLAMAGLTMAVFYNMYKRRRNLRKIAKANRPDPITGLPHFLIHKIMAEAILRQKGQEYAYVYFSIDRFRLIMELSGREYCNHLLKSVADELSHQLNEGELMTRYREDQFGMLLFYEDEIALRQRLVRMFKIAGEIPKTENNFCNITFYSGVCVIGRNKDMDKIIPCAKEAQHTGGIRSIANINFYSKQKVEEESKENVKEQVLEAIEQKQFLVYLQPKYRLDSEKMSGAEALVRWNHPKNGVLSPNIFLPLLEENGKITELDYYVLDQVCAFLAGCIRGRKQLVPVSINLSVRHLEQESFVRDLVAITDRYQIPHSIIELEFPEVAVYERVQELGNVMRELSKEGFLISIDNFGVGFLSTHLLKELPIQVIKIDRGLIRDLEDSEFSEKDRTVVTHIISLAKEMKVEVVAEGVETQGQKDLLQQQHCDVIQGFYYQKPMPLNDFERFLKSC